MIPRFCALYCGLKILKKHPENTLPTTVKTILIRQQQPPVLVHDQPLIAVKINNEIGIGKEFLEK